MKRLFAAGVALLALASTATAADLSAAPYYRAPVPYAVPLFTWTGFYLGINGGGAFGSSTWDKHQHVRRARRWHGRIQLPDQPFCVRR